MKSTFITTFFLIYTVLAGCHSTQLENHSTPSIIDKIIIKNIDGQVIAEITDPHTLQPLFSAIEDREIVVLKKPPSFNFIIHTIQAQQENTWLYAQHGYLKAYTKSADGIYKVQLPQVEKTINP